MPKQVRSTGDDATVKEPFLSSGQVARMLGVSERWISLHQELKRYRVGRYVRFLERDIHAHIRRES